ncbi:sensor histidine kinase [Mycolicibacterium sediminis]|uniref:ATPase n=1 Tax=Mycolicibacterium sediminis TaxID=1286180 RepID=A0A7I7QM08_9MYCO|nr:ATP-binding protein [Mycolicibacterium sediminis]BBY27314.1 ATPase [Mycolicibacterium sediminis]
MALHESRWDRTLGYFASDPVRVSAFLRLPLIVLIAVLVWIWDVDSWLPEVYAIVLGVYAVAAVVWVAIVIRGGVPRWASWASTAIDVLVVVVLCLVSGGATAALLPVFFLLPISVAFQDRPVLTGVLGISAPIGYLAVWIVYSKRDDHVGLPDIVYTQVGFLLWLAVAVTALCFFLARRQARVDALQEVRRLLVAEAMSADERHNREIAEHLHDGPLQNLLAARMEVDELRERSPDPALDLVYDALQQTAASLRAGVSELHPQVLAQLGLEAGVRELLRQFQNRGSYVIVADLDDVGKPESQALMYRAARELLANVHKHARATHVEVGLRRAGEHVVLTVRDDGAGFDPDRIADRVADGHIGLGSLLARFDAMGGAMEFDSSAHGTLVTVTSPPETSAGVLRAER